MGWTEVWNAEDVTGDTSWLDYNPSNVNRRNLIEIADIVSGGTKIRLTFMGPSAGNDCVVDGTSIGPAKASSDAYDYDSAPTRVTFNTGSSTATVPQGGTLVSDEITYDFDETVDHIIHTYSANNEAYVDHTSGGTAWQRAYATDDTMTTDVSSYSTYNYFSILYLIEAYTATDVVVTVGLIAAAATILGETVTIDQVLTAGLITAAATILGETVNVDWTETAGLITAAATVLGETMVTDQVLAAGLITAIATVLDETMVTDQVLAAGLITAIATVLGETVTTGGGGFVPQALSYYKRRRSTQ